MSSMTYTTINDDIKCLIDNAITTSGGFVAVHQMHYIFILSYLPDSQSQHVSVHTY